MQLQVILGSIILILLAALIKSIQVLYRKNKQLKKYQPIIDIDEALEKSKKISEDFEAHLKDLSEKVDLVKREYDSYSDEVELLSSGFYKPRYQFDQSSEYKRKIDEIREMQKQMIRDKTAVICKTEWSVGGSKAEGRKMTNRTIKLALNAYNVQCDNIILTVNHKNIERSEERMSKLEDTINKLLEPNNTHVTTKFSKLKEEELHLVHEYQEKLYQEKEEQRLIKEQMREEEKARKEIEKAQRDAEKEESMYETALAKARNEIGQASDKKRAKLEAEIEELQRKLEEAHQKKDRALSMAQQTKRGHVYVISNVGSFGENVHKIGMTRRLEPMDRVKELGDASVPFEFDVHAMIYSEDAPDLERRLHESFTSHRMNRVNHRKEFFNVSAAEIRKLVDELGIKASFTMLAEAREFRDSLAILKESETQFSLQQDSSSQFMPEIKQKVS